MEDDSLGYHGIMKILCNPHFIGYKVIKQKVSQLPLPWEVLMMLCSKYHGYCPNGESVPPSVSRQEWTVLTREPLESLSHLEVEREHHWSRKWHFPPQADWERDDRHKNIQFITVQQWVTYTLVGLTNKGLVFKIPSLGFM